MDQHTYHEERSACISSIYTAREHAHDIYVETLERMRGVSDDDQDHLRNDACQQIAVFLKATDLYLKHMHDMP